ncbi:zf-TFIIB domain-containing protein [Bradyrhizobium sp. 33ap4]|uniref:zf-TFIIB domain-containing protein n=1 Tax=Bradyrhizobium sp. 33ap4 TaxID=3061630 RepID=UPI003977841A
MTCPKCQASLRLVTVLSSGERVFQCMECDRVEIGEVKPPSDRRDADEESASNHPTTARPKRRPPPPA